jgi:integrase
MNFFEKVDVIIRSNYTTEPSRDTAISALEKYLQYLSEVKVDFNDATKTHALNFLDSRETLCRKTKRMKKISVRTKKKYQAILNSIYKNLDMDSPFQRISLPKTGEGRVREAIFVTRKDRDAILKALDNVTETDRRNRALIMFYFATSCRREAAIKLRLCDLSVTPHAITINYPSTKGRESDKGYVAAWALKDITRYYNWRLSEVRGDRGAYLFGASQGSRAAHLMHSDYSRPMSSSTAYTVLQEVSKKVLGYPVKLHDLRAHAITYAISVEGAANCEVQGFSGHQSPTMLNLYDQQQRDRGAKIALKMVD